MESQRSTFNTTFWVEGDGLDPDEFTRVVGIQPARTTRKGELSPHPASRAIGKKSPTTSWEINFERESSNMDREVQQMLAMVWEKRDPIRECVLDKLGIVMGLRSTPTIPEQCVDPAYDLSVETIQKLASLGCDFSMDDVYDYRPPLPVPVDLEGWQGDEPFLTTSGWVGGEGFDLPEWKACVKDVSTNPPDNGKGSCVEVPQSQGEVPGLSWQLTRTSRYYSTDEAVREVLAPLWTNRAAIQAYLTKRPRVMGNVRCRVKIVEDRTVYELLPATLQQLACFGWAFRFEVRNYALEDEDEDD